MRLQKLILTHYHTNNHLVLSGNINVSKDWILFVKHSKTPPDWIPQIPQILSAEQGVTLTHSNFLSGFLPLFNYRQLSLSRSSGPKYDCDVFIDTPQALTQSDFVYVI